MLDLHQLARFHKHLLENPEYIYKVPPKLLDYLQYDWLTPIFHGSEVNEDGTPLQIFGGREKQLFQNYYTKQKNIILVLAGRGFGKTKSASEYIKYWLFNESLPGCSILYVAPVFGHLKFLQTDPAGITKCMPPGYKPIPKGNKALYFEAFDVTLYFSTPESFEANARGKNTSLLVFDELCAMQPVHKTEEMFEITELANRITCKSYPKILITTTPKPTIFLKKLTERADVQIIRGSTFENAANLDDVTIQRAKSIKGTNRGKEEIYAELLFDQVHNMFPPIHLVIDENAINLLPKDSASRPKVIVALDPATVASKTNDDFGFIVAGKIPGFDPVEQRNPTQAPKPNSSKSKMVVLEDLSGHYSQIEVRNKIMELKKKYCILGVVVEKNGVGDSMSALLKECVPEVKAFHALQSKGTRASLVSPYWEMGRIVFAREHKVLQEQMFNFDPQLRNQKDDHLDGLVYAGLQIFKLFNLLENEQKYDPMQNQFQYL